MSHMFISYYVHNMYNRMNCVQCQHCLKQLYTRVCYLSNIGCWWTRWTCRSYSPSSDIQNTAWYRKKVASTNIHKITRIMLLVLNLETETFLWIKALPNLLKWFHHTVEYVKALHLLQHTILKLVATLGIFWTEWKLIFTSNKCESVNKTTIQPVREGFPTLFLFG